MNGWIEGKDGASLQKMGKRCVELTVFLLKLNSQKNTGANNQAIDGHLQENREETNNLYGFIVSKSWSIMTLEGHAKESIMSYTWISL